MTKHTMPALTDDYREKLVNWLTTQRDACDELHGTVCTDERCVTSKIALAALTADAAPTAPVLKAIELPRHVTHVTNKFYEEGRDDVIAAVIAAGYQINDE